MSQPTAQLFYIGAKALILNAKGELLLLLCTPKQNLGGITYWDFPGGRVDNENRIENTLKREVHEEIGVNKIVIESLVDVVIANFISDQDNSPIKLALVVYKCSVQNGKIILSEEHSNYGWFSPKEASKLLSAKYPKEFTEKLSKLVYQQKQKTPIYSRSFIAK